MDARRAPPRRCFATSPYFPRADTTQLWLALASWAVLGLVLSVDRALRNTGAASRAAIEEAEETTEHEHEAHHREPVGADA